AVTTARRDEDLPRELFLEAVGGGRPPEDDDTLDRRRSGDGLRDDPEERHVFALAIRDVRREQHARTGETDALAEGAGAEPGEHDEDDHADADGAEHEDDGFRRRRHVDGDAVALSEAHRPQRAADALGLAMKLGVGQRPALAALVLGDERDVLAVSRRDMVVDAVVREVRDAARVPTKGRRLPVQDAIPLPKPRDLLRRAAPEALRVVGRLAAPRADLRDRVFLPAHARSRNL